jgi:hypothetical protein
MVAGFAELIEREESLVAAACYRPNLLVGLREGTNSLDSVWAKEQTTAASIQYRV